jgi:hypothetical protein
MTFNTNTLNLHAGHEDFTVQPGIGPVIYYHGSAIDLRKVTRNKAEEMAKDKVVKYIQFSPAALEKQAKAAIASSAK